MKLKLTESQFDRLKANLSEVENDNSYSREVRVDINYYNGVMYKGMEINDILSPSVRLSYNIEIDARSWGIKDISLYNISGPSEIQAEIEYYVDDDNTSADMITLAIDWSKLTTDTNNNGGIITVGDVLEINLMNDKQGNLFVKDLNIEVYSA
jgi:hypothetical protein